MFITAYKTLCNFRYKLLNKPYAQYNYGNTNVKCVNNDETENYEKIWTNIHQKITLVKRRKLKKSQEKQQMLQLSYNPLGL